MYLYSILLTIVIFCCCLVNKSCPMILQPHFATPFTVAWFLCPWDFPGKNTGMECRFFLQEIFLTQGSNPHFLLWWADSLTLSLQGGSSFILDTHTHTHIYIYKFQKTVRRNIKELLRIILLKSIKQK